MSAVSWMWFHYPLIFWDGNKKRLYNPVNDSIALCRPEERVRLRTIGFLHDELGFSYGLMAVERGYKIYSKQKRSFRLDILCYDKEGNPFLLVECKRSEIVIEEKLIGQIIRYSSSCHAPWLMITNGKNTILVNQYASGKYRFVENDVLPSVFISSISRLKQPEYNYWRQRGFLLSVSCNNEAIQSVIQQLLNEMWLPFEGVKKEWIDLNITGLDMSSYYCAIEVAGIYSYLGFVAQREVLYMIALINKNYHIWEVYCCQLGEKIECVHFTDNGHEHKIDVSELAKLSQIQNSKEALTIIKKWIKTLL